MKKLKDYAENKFSVVNVLVGSNDCEKNLSNMDEIMKHYQLLINEAKRVSTDQVKISSICPRNMGDAIDKRITDFNMKLHNLCSEKDCQFIDNDVNFRLQNGTIDDSMLLPDNRHLSQRGTVRLLNNLGLSKVCRYRDRRNLPRYDSSLIQSRTTRPDLNVGPQNKDFTRIPTTSTSASSWSTHLLTNNQYDRQAFKNQGWSNSIQQNGSSATMYNIPQYQTSRQFNHNNRSILQADALPFYPASGQDRHWGSQSYQPRCWLCGEQGHVADSCSNGNYISCFKCGGTGHKSHMCPSSYPDRF